MTADGGGWNRHPRANSTLPPGGARVSGRASALLGAGLRLAPHRLSLCGAAPLTWYSPCTQAAANAAEAELASKETVLKGDAGSVKQQLLTALDIKYGSMIRRLEGAVKEATAARQTAHEAREDKEGRAQAAGKGVGALRDAADEADALAQRAMEAAELSVQEDVQVGRRSLGYRLLLLSSCCCVRCCCCVAGSTDLST